MATTAFFSTWGNGSKEVSPPADLPFQAIMGWDGIIINHDNIDVVDLTREFAVRAKAESCGQCFPCRMGTIQIADILERICAGQGAMEDLQRLEKLSLYIQESSRCDIGQTSPKPILDALQHFREEFIAAIDSHQPRPRGNYVTQVTAPCMGACPDRVDVPGYVERIRDNRLKDSFELVMEKCCMPGTIGRVCVRPCEAKCRRGVVDEPIAIRALKRVVGDADVAAGGAVVKKSPGGTKDKIAVIGAGPAGLSCAYYLALAGYRPTIFEAGLEPGGMAAVGIPDYRLPRKDLRAEVDRVCNAGVEIKYGVTVGQDVTVPSLLEQGYKAVFVGAGAPGSSSMGCEGEDAGYKGFMPGVEFLRRVAGGERPLEGKKILVIGGGNVAMDCVRSALRLGFDDVNLLYRRTEKEMPADPVEITESKEEGVKIHTLVAPVRVIARNGVVTGLECQRMKLGEPDASGRRRPIPEEGSNFVIECDAIVPAIGQACEVNKFAPEGVEVARNNTLVVDPITLQSALPQVFGGGDCVTGPSTLVAALAAGRRAARFIGQYLETGKCTPSAEDYLDQACSDLGKAHVEEAPPFATQTKRAHPPMLAPEVRVKDFTEAESALSVPEARREASRCLRCYRIVVAAVA